MARWLLFILLAAATASVVLPSSAPAQAPATTDAPASLTPDDAAPAAPANAGGAKAGKHQPGFLEILFSGGPLGVVIMLVLIALSLTAAYLVFDNAMLVRESELVPDELGERVRQLVAAGRVAEADQLCKAQPGFLAYVLQHGLAELDGGWSQIEKALEESLAEQAARLYRRIDYLSTIGNMAPMVGLLGTVTGMLLAFYTLATTGTAGATELAEGIYQALVTTVIGLIIAIPSLGAFAYFRNRADEVVAHAAYVAQHVFAPLRRRSGASAAAAAPPAPPLAAQPVAAAGVAAPPRPPAGAPGSRG